MWKIGKVEFSNVLFFSWEKVKELNQLNFQKLRKTQLYVFLFQIVWFLQTRKIVYLILNRWFLITFDHTIISDNIHYLWLTMYIWKYIHYKWINCFERFTVGLNFPRKFLNFFLYIIRYKDPASFFSIETDLIKPHIRGIRWHERNFDVARCNVCDKGGANKRRIKSRIKPGRISSSFLLTARCFMARHPSNVILFVNPKGGHGWENELDYQ